MILIGVVAISMVRASIAVIWALAPPMLIAFAIRNWKKDRGIGFRTRVLPLAVGIGVLIDWVLFLTLLACGQIGGFGTHYITTRSANWFLIGSLALLIASIATKVERGKLALSCLLVLALWMGSEIVM